MPMVALSTIGVGVRHGGSMHIISVLGRLRQKNCHEFKIILDYKMGSRAA